MAKSLGFVVPETLVTSSDIAAREFIRAHTDVICKGVHNHFLGFSTATVRVAEREMALLEALKFCPAIFQARVNVRRNIRVVICGERSFTFESDDVGIDWRLHPNSEWRIHDLPAAVHAALKSIVLYFGLVYASFDLILNTSGEYVFLELNPGGQFFFLEVWTEAGIPDAIVDMLLGAPKG